MAPALDCGELQSKYKSSLVKDGCSLITNVMLAVALDIPAKCKEMNVKTLSKPREELGDWFPQRKEESLLESCVSSPAEGHTGFCGRRHGCS